jgi:hypothetical protein
MRGPTRQLLARFTIESLRSLNSSSVSTSNMGLGGSLSRRFVEALGKSIGVIGASEIGDKTFFIAAIMAMRSSRVTVMPAAGCTCLGRPAAARRADCCCYCCCCCTAGVLWSTQRSGCHDSAIGAARLGST